ncbi:hypothetical protein J1TS3_37550 [Siminovitchia fordii]|uniref:Uncharacterized protein n=1 Tax=Siminovitchia fordii TaxID=254759 RepID=A0ABQ4KA84_9BACI|nr:hypothetical protein J1TS3_37550 [Siminovitchia fordii]
MDYREGDYRKENLERLESLAYFMDYTINKMIHKFLYIVHCITYNGGIPVLKEIKLNI